jgi:hypothetical protein
VQIFAVAGEIVTYMCYREVEAEGVIILLCCSLSSKSGSFGSCGFGKTTSAAAAEAGGSLAEVENVVQPVNLVDRK